MASSLARELIPTIAIDASFTGVKDNNGDQIGRVEVLPKDTNFIGHIVATGVSAATKEITSITARADVADDLDGTYFILQDEIGSVGFWIDVDNGGTTIPAGASAADRAVEITTVTTGMTAEQVGDVVYVAVIGDSKFEAGSDAASPVILVRSTTTGLKVDGADGDTGFIIAEDTKGNEVASYAAKIQHSHDGVNYFDLLAFSTVSVATSELVVVNNTDDHVARYIRTVITKTTGDATFTIDLLYDRR